MDQLVRALAIFTLGAAWAWGYWELAKLDAGVRQHPRRVDPDLEAVRGYFSSIVETKAVRHRFPRESRNPGLNHRYYTGVTRAELAIDCWYLDREVPAWMT